MICPRGGTEPGSLWDSQDQGVQGEQVSEGPPTQAQASAPWVRAPHGGRVAMALQEQEVPIESLGCRHGSRRGVSYSTRSTRNFRLSVAPEPETTPEG